MYKISNKIYAQKLHKYKIKIIIIIENKINNDIKLKKIINDNRFLLHNDRKKETDGLL